ncbi:MAG: cellulose biosynthesis protein BcsN, partial [Notoacmeibacter sp.]
MSKDKTIMAAAFFSRFKHSGLRAVAVLALIAPLSACVFNNPLDRQLTSATILEPSPLDGYQYELAEDVPLSRAFMELPAMAGPIIAVREKRYANGIEQIMVLESEAAADGENRIEVRVIQPGKSDDRIKNEYLQVRNTRQEQIRSDMKEFVWGIPMQIVASVEANAYGTYGYALGRSKIGYNCLLGWQNVKGVMKERRLLGFTTISYTDMSVRLRICRTDLSYDQLVSIVRGMRITVDPAALMQEPKMIWRNEGYNISGSQLGNGTAPGYVTEGVAMPEGTVSAPEVATIDPQPSVESNNAAPVYQSAPRRQPAASSAQPRQRVIRDPKTNPPVKRRIVDGQEQMVRAGDPTELNGLDKDRNHTTIFVDPREYATVPAPGEGSAVQGTIERQPMVTGKPSVFSTLGKSSTLKPATAAGAQSKEAREQRKAQIREIPLASQALSNTKLDRNGARASSGGGSGDNRDLFLAPEREGYRGLDVDDLQRQSRVEGKNAKHNLWLNDVARNDRDGMPLGRPCEL